MPIRNMGTLVENVVLAEALRALAATGAGPIDFANAFAMPPLAAWRQHALDHCIKPEHHRRLAQGPRPEPGSFAGLAWHCVRHSPTSARTGRCSARRWPRTRAAPSACG